MDYKELTHQVKCRVGSDLVDDNPRVLQIMVFGDNNMMVEMLPQDVFEGWIGKDKEDNV